MGKLSENLFSQAELKRIEAAVASAESATIGEIVVMLVDNSDNYAEAEAIGGFVVASFISLLITIAFFAGSLWEYVPLSFILFFPARMIFSKIPQLKRAFIGASHKEKAVRERALAAFYEKGLYETKDNTGVLFFLSIFERKVWVLADKGICLKIDQSTLNSYAQAVSQGVREGRACEAVCEAVGRMGKLLAEHFPLKPGDINELGNEVIRD